MSASPQAPFEQATEVVLYDASRRATGGRFSGTGQAIEDMFRWNYGLPFAEALPNGEAMVLYYAPGRRYGHPLGAPGAMIFHHPALLQRR